MASYEDDLEVTEGHEGMLPAWCHVPLAVVVGAQRREATHAVDLTDRAELLWSRASQILTDVEGAPLLELAAIRELRAVVDLLARLAGPLIVPDGPVTIQLSSPHPKSSRSPGSSRPTQTGGTGMSEDDGGMRVGISKYGVSAQQAAGLRPTVPSDPKKSGRRGWGVEISQGGVPGSASC